VCFCFVVPRALPLLALSSPLLALLGNIGPLMLAARFAAALLLPTFAVVAGGLWLHDDRWELSVRLCAAAFVCRCSCWCGLDAQSTLPAQLFYTL